MSPTPTRHPKAPAPPAPHRHAVRWELPVAAVSAGALLLLGGCAQQPKAKATGSAGQASAAANAATPVVTTAARVGNVSRTVTVTGSLVALQNVALSAKQGGRLTEVAVREGDSVAVGQIVARIDATDLESQVRSAEASVASARAKLAQAEAAYAQQRKTTETDIASARAAYNQQVATSSAQIRSSEAALRSARASLSTVQEGARPEERTQTQATLASAEANVKKAQSDLERYEKLHAAGAVSDAEIDQYRNARDVAQASLNSARAAVELQQKGSRHQEVVQAQQQVRQAEESLRQAQAARATDAVRKAALDAAIAARAQNEVKRADVLAARASVREAQNALEIARQAVRDSVVRSPIAGRVSARSAEPGQVAASGTTLLQVVALDSVYFEPSVPNTAVGQVSTGQSVTVTVDAFPGRTFPGTVSRVYPSGSSTNRSFPVRVSLDNPSGSLRPQMFARGTIQTSLHQNAVLIPREALLSSQSTSAGSQNRVFLVEDGVAHEKTITIGLSSSDGNWFEADGVPTGAQVVTLGQRTLKDGQRVTPTTSSNATTTTAAR